MRIDFHQHVWTDAVRELLEQRSEPPLLRGRRLVLPQGGEFDVDPGLYAPPARLRELRAHGLDAAVVSLPPTTEPSADLVEAWHAGAQALAAETQGRLIPLAYRSARPGFAGAIVSAGDFDDLGALEPLLARLERAGQLLFVHPGPAPAAAAAAGWWSPGVAYTGQMQAAFAAWIGGGAAHHPKLRVVFALLGGGAPFQVERLVRRGLDARAPFVPNVWFETSSYGERAVELSLQTFGAARLLFGSDAPVDSVEEALHVIGRFGRALEGELLVSNPLSALGGDRYSWAA